MQIKDEYDSFRLSTGGLFYRFFTRIHIQDPDNTTTIRRHAALVTLCWLPLILLTAIEGNLINSELDLPFIYDLKPYVRYLIVLPILIEADGIIDRLVSDVLLSISTSGILGDDGKDAYSKAVDQLAKRKDSNIADIVILIVIMIIALSLLANLDNLDVSSEFTSWMTVYGDSKTTLTYAGWWFLLVSSPILLIILFRWFWRFYLWSEFLYRVSRIKLYLQPAHPDMAAGLGILKNSESAFTLIAFAFGSMLSVAVAEDILYTDMTLIESLPVVAVYIGTAIIIMTLPLLFFSKQIARVRLWGRVAYGNLGYQLSRAFDEKWANPSDQNNGDELLKKNDSSAVCDYAEIYSNVRSVQIIPTSLRDYLEQIIVLIIPFLPLVLTEHSITDVLKRIMDTLV